MLRKYQPVLPEIKPDADRIISASAHKTLKTIIKVKIIR